MCTTAIYSSFTLMENNIRIFCVLVNGDSLIHAGQTNKPVVTDCANDSHDNLQILHKRQQ